MTSDDAPAHQTSPHLALGPIQATVIALALCARLGLEPAQAGLVRLVALLGWAAFISLVLLLITVLGDIGRLLASMLLIFQLAAARGIYSIEFSPGVYGWAGCFLRSTPLPHALRAAMFARKRRGQTSLAFAE